MTRYGGIVKLEIDYAEPGPLTELKELAPEVLEGIGDDPVQVCTPVHLLVVQPDAARDLGLGEARLGERNLRPAARILGALLALNPAPVGAGRPPGQRVVGTCRHFALLSCAFLRYRGIAARVRCGFATYFQSGQGLDHWITEYRNGGRSLGQDRFGDPRRHCPRPSRGLAPWGVPERRGGLGRVPARRDRRRALRRLRDRELGSGGDPR
jgi:hypothetical protein